MIEEIMLKASLYNKLISIYAKGIVKSKIIVIIHQSIRIQIKTYRKLNTYLRISKDNHIITNKALI